MLHIVDIAIDDKEGLSRLASLLRPDDALLLTGNSLAWPDTHPLLDARRYGRLNDQLADDALAALIRNHNPILCHTSDQGPDRHD